MFIKIISPATLLFITFSLQASADPWTINPLYLLNHEKLCTPKEPKATTSSEADNNADPDEAEEDSKKEIHDPTPDNITKIGVPGTDKYYWRVNNEHIIDEVLEEFSLALKYSDIQKNGLKTSLKKEIAPCHGTETSETESKCAWDNPEAAVWHAPSARFPKKAANVRARFSLLKLFNAAETGRINGFVVIRNKWSSELDGFTEYNASTNDTPRALSAFSYRPFVNPHLDDELLAEFVEDQTPEVDADAPPAETTVATSDPFDGLGSPFVVMCYSGNEDAPFQSPTTEDPTPVLADIEHLSDADLERLEITDRDNPGNKLPKVENTIGQSTPAYLLVPAINWVGKEREFSFLNRGAYENKSKIRLVGTPGDFAKSDPDKASVKLVAYEDESQNLFTGNAALGYQLSWAKDKNSIDANDSKYSLSLTPYLSANFEAIEAVRLAPTVADPFATDDVKVSFADLSAGIRLDYVGEKGVFKKDSLDTLRKRVSRSGIRRPGWRWSGTWERFTDNYNQQHGERTGVELAFPDWFSFPGYRKRFALIENRRPAPFDRDRKHNPLRFGLLTGWGFEWDAEFAYDRVDFLQAPLNFQTAEGGDRQEVSEFSVPGANVSLYLGKQAMLGYAEDDGWFALTADYVYRTGYETTPFGSAEKWELGAEFQIPNVEAIEWSAKYEFGRDFKTLQEIDAVTLELKLEY